MQMAKGVLDDKGMVAPGQLAVAARGFIAF